MGIPAVIQNASFKFKNKTSTANTSTRPKSPLLTNSSMRLRKSSALLNQVVTLMP